MHDMYSLVYISLNYTLITYVFFTDQLLKAWSSSWGVPPPDEGSWVQCLLSPAVHSCKAQGEEMKAL